jgi:hypothetical protein
VRQRGRPIATAEINSLAAFGFPQAVLDAWAGDIPRLKYFYGVPYFYITWIL